MESERKRVKNPYRLTNKQHVFPKAGIARFCNSSGTVHLFSKKLNKATHFSPGNDFFCVKRVWDQSAENGFGKHVEDRFSDLVKGIISGNVKKIGVFEKPVVEQFFSLWRTRHKFKVEGLPDIDMPNFARDQLSEEEQEILESKHVTFTNNGVLPGRFAASAHLFGFYQKFAMNNHSIQWGIVRAGQGEFIVPDCFEDMMVVPLSPTIAIAADQPNSILSLDEVAFINQLALSRLTDYFFARDFSKCPIIRRKVPKLHGLFALHWSNNNF